MPKPKAGTTRRRLTQKLSGTDRNGRPWATECGPQSRSPEAKLNRPQISPLARCTDARWSAKLPDENKSGRTAESNRHVGPRDQK
jgi:hypothetical protein